MATMQAHVLGLDIGGANLKAAVTDGTALTRRFQLWRQPEQLPAEVTRLIREFPCFDRLAVTMTGELCDCFASRSDGVRAILDTVESVSTGRAVDVWQNDGRFVSIETARSNPLQIASANWLALATFSGRFIPHGPALLVDIGSTTTDIVPLVDGQPQPRGRTDLERLQTQELAYVGSARTPLFAFLPSASLRNQRIWLIPELFATAKDVLLMLGWLPESELDCDTADGAPATRRHARSRIARHFGADGEMLTADEVLAICQSAKEILLQRIARAVSAVWSRLTDESPIVISAGSGESLVEMVARRLDWTLPRVSLREKLGPELSTAAPAYAVAVLASEMPR
jgi:hypothetical protein